MRPVISHHREHIYGLSARFRVAIVAAVVCAAFLGPISLATPVMAIPGALDSSYGENGTVAFPTNFYQFVYLRAAIQPDGKVVVAYTRVVPHQGGANFALSVRRYLPNGELDTSGEWPTVTLETMFGPGGELGFIHPIEVLIRPDGKILVASVRLSIFADTVSVALLRPNGTVQTTFTADVLEYGGGRADFAVLPDNRLIAITRSGSIKSFAANGSLVSTIPVPIALDAQIVKLAEDAEGRIVVSAASSGNTSLTRYNSDLTVDSSFCGGSPCSYPWTAREIEITGDGKILTMDLTKITRHLPDGSLDAGFGISGHFSTPDVTRSMKVDSLGRIVVALEKTAAENELWVIEADGSVSEKLLTSNLEFFGEGRFFFQEDGKLIAIVSHDVPFPAQTPFQANLVRVHYEDEGKVADLRIETTGITPARDVRPGDEITFEIRVTNDGKNKAGHLTLENSLPHGTTFVSLEEPEGWVTYQQPKFMVGKVSCSGYSLAAGQSVEFRLTLRVNTFGKVRQVSNTAVITSEVFDPTIFNNVTNRRVPVQ